VFTKQGREQWILVHIEVQGYQDAQFAQRMFTYFYRILDRYEQQVMALAILTDNNAQYHPQQYLYQYEHTKCSYEFPSFKVLQKTERSLQVPHNPFSVVMLAAKKALYKKNLTDAQQLIWKKSLVEALKDAHYSDDKIRRILHFIRYYVKFNEEESLQTLNKNIQTTFKHRKNMGIEEAILQAVREEAVEEGIHKGVLQTALRMKQAGVSTADIVKFTGLTKAQVEKLA
jgi:predicted transposase/invertase (TIGR01784 family)